MKLIILQEKEEPESRECARDLPQQKSAEEQRDHVIIETVNAIKSIVPPIVPDCFLKETAEVRFTVLTMIADWYPTLPVIMKADHI